MPARFRQLAATALSIGKYIDELPEETSEEAPRRYGQARPNPRPPAPVKHSPIAQANRSVQKRGANCRPLKPRRRRTRQRRNLVDTGGDGYSRLRAGNRAHALSAFDASGKNDSRSSCGSSNSTSIPRKKVDDVKTECQTRQIRSDAKAKGRKTRWRHAAVAICSMPTQGSIRRGLRSASRITRTLSCAANQLGEYDNAIVAATGRAMIHGKSKALIHLGIAFWRKKN